jgi:hypothetical protein
MCFWTAPKAGALTGLRYTPKHNFPQLRVQRYNYFDKSIQGKHIIFNDAAK